MSALRFLDEFIEVGEFIRKIRSNLRLFIPIVINELLEQLFLSASVLNQAVDEPR